ncbi:alpha/beta fold hydrolase [Aestuariirhabdus litorea]|uniref:Alpha/beta fold hydrolase n=1 Tax=Aestuariirhabdus litorea TaxID=2528527 RepID=A0A3P3VKY5_9GAMM|nr:alpha/beta hydrolase [Aestuariirhabdus litorea]RRJ83385.1 alpha/beta fold hydrolase [Aestuariirhabdus litorea]RWW93544.1 alpha/beta fold hydrolase [Endozoicomonadaceae bacterium GTF-13]
MTRVDHYIEQGAGEPILFVHGSYATPSTWRRIIEGVGPGHHCIAIKLPGHGGAPEPEDFDAPTIETELALIESVVSRLTDRPIHLVGHSYGGVVALALALKGSLPIAEMTLFEPVAVWVLKLLQDQEMVTRVEQFLAAYFEAAARQEPDACGRVIDFWGGGELFARLPASVQAAMVPLLDNNLRHWQICTRLDYDRAALSRCTLPTRLVCGSDSNPVAHAIIDHLARELPCSQRYQITGANHALVTSHPEQCLAILSEPLARSGD